MAHDQKNHISSLQPNERVHLIGRWASVHSTTGSRGVRISSSNAGYSMFRGSVKGTAYPPHSTVSPSLPLRVSTFATTFQLHSTAVNSQYPYRLPSTQTPHYNTHTVSFPALTFCVSHIHICFVQP